ncbi:MAG TPA: ATP-grasp domain-containing protein [Candidatus Acidoferrum sp.]|nr:ATP-grasp domain-containing protein [Candidatus Acidoferrum sp.]
MSYSLILADRATGLNYTNDMNGESVLSRHPGRPLVFLDERFKGRLQELPNCVYEYMPYMTSEAVIDRARHYQQTAGLSSVCTFDEYLVYLAAEVRTALGLPGMKVEQARRFRDKVLMKTLLRAAGVRVPEFVASCADCTAVNALLARHGPIVVKPHDGAGSKGVTFFTEAAALDAFLERLSEPGQYEAEEFIAGTLYHVNSVVGGGKVLYSGVGIYLPGKANIDFSDGQSFSTVTVTDGALHDALKRFAETVIAVLELTSGVTHMEAFVTQNSEIVFCEIAARPPGGGIVTMLNMQHGIDLWTACMLCEEGMAHRALAARSERSDRVGVCGLRNAAMGIVELDPEAATAHADWVRYVKLSVSNGQFRAPSAHCTDFTAMVVLTASSTGQFRERVDEIERRYATHLRLVAMD